MTSAPVRDPLADHLLTPQSAALLFIDYQPSQLAGARSMDRALLVKNAVSTVKTIKTFEVLVLHSTVNVATGREQPTPPRPRRPSINWTTSQASRRFWRSPRSGDPAAAWRPATCFPPPSNPPRHHRSPGTVALNMNDGCTHLDRIHDVTPSSWGCEDRLAQGRRDWVHLRVCQECGHAGRCDNSPVRHTTAHFHVAGHPVVRWYEPGEDWYWCYLDRLVFGLEGARRHRRTREGLGRTDVDV